MESPALSPADARPVTVNEGRRLHASADWSGAEMIYRAVLAVAPEDPDALHLLGILRHQRGDSAEAVSLIRRALALRPDHAPSWSNLTLPLAAEKRFGEAAEAGAEAVRLAPENAGNWVNLAMALNAGGRPAEAAEAAEAAIAIEPGLSLGWQHLGQARLLEKRFGAAERHFRRAITLAAANGSAPGEAQAGLAQALYGLMRYGEATAVWRSLLDADPASRVARLNLGASLRAEGQFAAALGVWSEGESGPETEFNTGCTYLLLGDWTRGFEGYERRYDVPIEPVPAKVAGVPLWTGEPLAGTLLVHHEQGLGDTVQFLPLIARLLTRVARIVMVCQPALAAFLGTCQPVKAAGRRILILRDGEPLPAVDAWLPLLSAPHRLALQPSDLKSEPAYRPDPARVRAWAERLERLEGGTRRFRIGINWQGNPKAPAEVGRSIPLTCFAPLGTVPGVSLVVLQKGFGREQIAQTALALIDPGTEFDAGPDAFLDTAALAASLDLVITSDTAVAHVAAATGRPVWLILKSVPDWRWGASSDLTPWYPSMRLFRQRMAGDWAEVMSRVVEALIALLGARGEDDPDGAASFAEGLAAHQAGQFVYALKHYERRLLLAPGDGRAANFAALATYEAGGRSRTAIDGALVLARRSVELMPADPDMLANAAVLFKAAGRLDEAEDVLRRALTQQPANSAVVQNLVNTLLGKGKPDDAVRVASKAAAAAPRDPAVLKPLAEALRAAGQLTEAAAAFRLAISLSPADLALRVTLGGLLVEMNDLQGARATFEEVLERDRRNVDALSNLGVVEKRLTGPALAVWLYGLALRTQPGHADALANLGSALADLGRGEDARSALERSNAAGGDRPESLMAIGMTLLAEGRFDEGLATYEHRLNAARLGIGGAEPPLPRWTGDNLAGRSILILCEQGFGDAIQFIRYATELKRRGAGRVVVGCRARLAALLASADGVDAVIPEGGSIAGVDVIAYAMSLPHLLGTRLETIPAAVPYLHPEPARATRWAEQLAIRNGFRIGINWQGNPDPAVDRGRSVPLAALEPLARIPGVRLIAIQKGAGTEQIAALAGRFELETLGPEFDEGPHAFLDTAAVMASLDLVISTDTAALHLAGALRRPTFALLKAHPEWRWQKEGAASPWYPSMRLFRQRVDEAEDASAPWRGAVERLCEAVAGLVAGNRRTLIPEIGPAALVPREDPDNRFLRALALHREGKISHAEQIYASILSEHAGHAESIHMLGAIALQRQAFRRALIFFREAEALGLSTPEFRTNLAIALRRVDRAAEAEAMLRGVIQTAPTAEAYINLGGLLADNGRPEEALEHLAEAVRLKPALALAHRLLGNALRDAGRPDEALAALDRAVALAPNDAEARIDRAHARLAGGDLRGGFADYEWRFGGQEMVERRFDAPRWTGAPFAGTLLVHGEQGLGDHLQFARFLGPAIARCRHLVLEVRRPMMALLATAHPGITVVEQGAPLPAYDAEVAMMSLPHVLGLSAGLAMGLVGGTAMAAPYIAADPARVAQWARRLDLRADGAMAKSTARKQTPTVGLVWQGNPKARADKGRSPPLDALKPMLAIPGVRFLALQKEHGLDQLAAYPGILHPGHDFDAGEDAFLDSAALLTLCDLVITSDTALAHLAGALLRPTWIMLKRVPDWRWGTTGDSSPWYPSMRLFRQSRAGDWAGVSEDLAAALIRWKDGR